LKLNAGIESLARGDLITAEKQLRNAIALAPDASRAHRGLAEVLRKRGQPAAADRELREAENLESKSVSVLPSALPRGQ